MDIGISTFPTDYSIDIALLARRAEDMGFESLWVPEHPIIPAATSSPWPGSPDGVIPKVYADIVDPFVALGRASAVTSALKLGTGICLVPERNPAAARQRGSHARHVLRRQIPVRHRRGLAEGRDRDNGRRFPAPLDADARIRPRHEVALDGRRKRVSRRILRLPAGVLVPAFGAASASAGVSGRDGSARVRARRGVGRTAGCPTASRPPTSAPDATA